MSRSCCTIFAVMCLSAAVASEPDYTALLEELWAKSDSNGDGGLSIGEFVSANEMLGLNSNIYTSHSYSYSAFFSAIDKDADGLVTQSELASAVTDFPEYQEPIIAAFTNGATTMPDAESLAPAPALVNSRATVNYVVTVAGPPDAIYAGERHQMKEYFATQAGVSLGAVVMTFKAVAGRRRASATADKRELQSTETAIDTTIFVRDAAAAEKLSEDLPATAADLEAVPAFGTVEVTEVTPAEPYSVPPLPIFTIGIIAAVLVVAFVFLVINARRVAKKVAKKKGQKGGCCSLHAVTAWAFGELLGACVVVGTVFYLYQNVNGVVDSLLGIVEFFTRIDALSAMVPELSAVSNNIPSTVTAQLDQVSNYTSIIPMMVMVPGVLAALFLLLGGACPVMPLNKGSLCWSKIYMFLATLFLALALIFYLVFASVAIFFAFAPPEFQDAIASVRGMCVAIPAQFGQQVTDGRLALDRLGASASQEMVDAIDQADEVVEVVTLGCTSMVSLIDELIGVFVPALMCVVAIVFAVAVNETLCCSAGCCCGGPKKSVKAKPDPAEAAQSV